MYVWLTSFSQTQTICPLGKPCYTVQLTNDEIAQQQTFALQYQQQISADSTGNANTKAALSQFLSLANSTVGVRADSLNDTQLLALFGLILFDAGAIDSSTYTIKPLNRWVK